MTKVRIILLAGLLVLVGLSGLAGCRSAHTTSAILYIDEQNYDKAVKVIHEGFEFRDDEPDAFYYLGEAYSHLAEEAVEDDDYDEAFKNYELAYGAYMKADTLDTEGFADKVEKALVYNYNNRVRQAKLDWDEDYFEQAEGHMRLAYAALPDSMSPIKNIARMKMQMSQMDEYIEIREDLLNEALVLLDQVLAKNPEAFELQLNKANVLAALGRNEEAKEIFDTLLAEHGDDTGLLIDIANLAIDDGDYARAGDFYVMVVDLNEADTDATNDADNKAMLVAAGTWYSGPNVGRYEDAITVLDRAADFETIPTDNTMLMRQRTYYQYGKEIKKQAQAETDPARKTELTDQSTELFNRAVEIGVAMTNNFPTTAEGFLYLSLTQFELGDFAAAETNNKTFEELQSAPQ
ncbi:MAG: tetratricopeptide repeat protein [Candidatus Krumholzibacteria bacterium]|nr:tetratricopeptide repeat protein [Candidatus Krumholzibacteria bacterium]